MLHVIVWLLSMIVLAPALGDATPRINPSSHLPPAGHDAFLTHEAAIVREVRQVAASTQPRVAFRTVSVRTSAPGGSEPSVTQPTRSGGFRAARATVQDLVRFAYQRHPFDERDVTGGPEWVRTARFDIEASSEDTLVIDDDGMPRQALAMVRTLLQERFGLRVREEQQDRPVYLLTLASKEGALGPKLSRCEVDCAAVMNGDRTTLPAGHGPACGMKTPPGRLFASTSSMPSIASLLSRHLDRPVVDATGLAGRFDLELESKDIEAAAHYQPGPSDLALPPAAGPALPVALREQLGLALEARTAAISRIEIEAATQPTPD